MKAVVGYVKGQLGYVVVVVVSVANADLNLILWND